MDLETLTTFAGHLTSEGTLVLVLALVGERLIEKGWIHVGKKEENADGTLKKSPTLESISGQMSQLQHHFNDDTTRLLTDILAEQKSTNVHIRNGMNRIENKFAEYDKYGIKANCPTK